MKPNTALRITAISGFLAVALGAIGAHGLESSLKAKLEAAQLAKQLGWWHTAGLYHIVHSVAMLAIALREPLCKAPWTLMLLGILLFSGSLYVMGATGNTALRHVTPIGGLFLLAGWLALAFPRRGC
jgi:uncharacterized membrane protein YgdD (TMEM256/DUF423 family)